MIYTVNMFFSYQDTQRCHAFWLVLSHKKISQKTWHLWVTHCETKPRLSHQLQGTKLKSTPPKGSSKSSSPRRFLGSLGLLHNCKRLRANKQSLKPVVCLPRFVCGDFCFIFLKSPLAFVPFFSRVLKQIQA